MLAGKTANRPYRNGYSRAEVRKKREVCVVTVQASPHANTGYEINGKSDLNSGLSIPQLIIICSLNPPYQPLYNLHNHLR